MADAHGRPEAGRGTTAGGRRAVDTGSPASPEHGKPEDPEKAEDVHGHPETPV